MIFFPVRTTAFFLAFAFFLAGDQSACSAADAETDDFEKWVYLQTNLLLPGQLRDAEKLIKRGSALGYKTFVISDPKSDELYRQPGSYFTNVRLLRKIAEDEGVKLIPSVFTVGYSWSLLSHNTNLIEGPPVKYQRFVVENGVAVPSPDPPPVIKGGDFSDLSQWDWMDPGVFTNDNGTAKASGMEDKFNARIVQKIKLTPWRQYLVKFKLKTEGLDKTPNYLILDSDGESLNRSILKIGETQPWKEYRFLFHSYDNTEATLYLGSWHKTRGSFWIDDCTIEETAFVNLTRRDSTPLTVKVEGEEASLTEGVEFAELRDPYLGEHEWTGNYSKLHEPPVLKILDRKKIPDGSVLRISYWVGEVYFERQVSIDVMAPETNGVIDSVMKRMHEAWPSDDYMMRHDEIRMLGWSQAAVDSGLTAGEQLAMNAAFCSRTIRKYAPKARLHAWNDMFDPFHCAIDKYHHINGSLKGSWQGLDPSVTILNWNYYGRDESLKFFSERGHPQIIAGFYDFPLQQVTDWLRSVEDVPNVKGFMYATWVNDFSKLEEVSQLIDNWKKSRSAKK